MTDYTNKKNVIIGFFNPTGPTAPSSVFVDTMLAGSIVKSRMTAVVGGIIFFKYQASWEHCELEDTRSCGEHFF